MTTALALHVHQRGSVLCTRSHAKVCAVAVIAPVPGCRSSGSAEQFPTRALLMGAQLARDTANGQLDASVSVCATTWCLQVGTCACTAEWWVACGSMQTCHGLLRCQPCLSNRSKTWTYHKHIMPTTAPLVYYAALALQLR